MKTWQKLNDSKHQTSFHVIIDLGESVSVGGGYLAATRVEIEASLSSELSGIGEAICTDGGGLSQRGVVLWSNGWGQSATPDGDEQKLAPWVSGNMINKRP